MKTFVVYAHHESKSMNAALLHTAVSSLGQAGEVQVSDLYHMGFNAVAGPEDFAGRSNPDFFKYQVEQVKAYGEGRLAEDIKAEQEKLLWCDLLILQFPLWWFSMPAVMKGWVDRVLTPGFAYGGGKLFERGPLRGRRALLSVTTGGLPDVFDENGKYGNLNQMLHHINYGMLAFCGFEVHQPFYVHGPARIPREQRERYIDEYRKRLSSLDSTPLLFSFPGRDFGVGLTLSGLRAWCRTWNRRRVDLGVDAA